MQRAVVLALLMVASGSALAAGSCSFTYNTISRRIEMRCEGGMASAPLGDNERIALISGKLKTCVVKANPERMKRDPKAGLFEAECK